MAEQVSITPTASASRPSLAHRVWEGLKPRLGWELALFLLIAAVALGLRLWDLDGRTMHYDESLHVHYSWRMAQGEGYSHSPWMHGPFQVHMVAFIFKIFGDSDFTSRLGYVLFGAALAMLPYFFRNYMGRAGALVTSLILALSPSLMYFSRFGRNDILIAFFASALLLLMWKYLKEGKNRYLYIASGLLALIFATKETSYIVVGNIRRGPVPPLSARADTLGVGKDTIERPQPRPDFPPFYDYADSAPVVCPLCHPAERLKQR